MCHTAATSSFRKKTGCLIFLSSFTSSSFPISCPFPNSFANPFPPSPVTVPQETTVSSLHPGLGAKIELRVFTSRDVTRVRSAKTGQTYGTGVYRDAGQWPQNGTSRRKWDGWQPYHINKLLSLFQPARHGNRAYACYDDAHATMILRR